MSEVYRLDGEIYESLKSGALRTGYTSDYIGQLSRDGHIRMRKLGRKVYVNSSDLTTYSSQKLKNTTKPRSFAAIESIETINGSFWVFNTLFERSTRMIEALKQSISGIYQGFYRSIKSARNRLDSVIENHDWVVVFWQSKMGALIVALMICSAIFGVASVLIEERIIFSVEESKVDIRKETIASPLQLVESLTPRER